MVNTVNKTGFDRHVLTSVLTAEKTLPGTFVKIHITNSKPFKSSDLYGVVYKVIKIKFKQFHSYQYNLQPFEKHRSLLSTFSMLKYLVVMYLCAIDIYFASFYDFYGQCLFLQQFSTNCCKNSRESYSDNK